MRSMKFAEMYRKLGEEEESSPKRFIGLFRVAGTLALAAFTLGACGDDSPDGPDDGDDTFTDTGTATATGQFTATATATGGEPDPNTFTATGPQTDPNTITDPDDPTLP